MSNLIEKNLIRCLLRNYEDYTFTKTICIVFSLNIFLLVFAVLSNLLKCISMFA